MKFILILIGFAWVLWSPVIVFFYFFRDTAAKTHGDIFVAGYASLVLMGWLIFQRNVLGASVFFIMVFSVIVAWPRRAR